MIVSDHSLRLAWYAVLSACGFFDSSEINFFGTSNALLTINPTVKVPGVDASISGGGYGLSIGGGIARSLKLDKKNNHVFVVLNDQDLLKGAVWEAAMNVAYDRLENITLLCLTSGLKKVASVQDKFEAFDWKVIKLVSGHDMKELVLALARAKETPRRPVCIVAPIISGKGVPFLEDKLEYRGSLLSTQEVEAAMAHLQSVL